MKFTVRFFILAALSFLVLLGCSEKLIETPGEIMMIQIGVDGMTASQEITGATSSRNVPRMATNFANISPVTSAGQVGFVTSYTTTQEGMESDSDNNASSVFSEEGLAKSQTINRATTTMPAGFTYRILLYNKASGEYWRTISARSGTPATIEAQRGGTYTWYAYSYNNTDEIPIPENLADPSIETSIDRGLMYATGEITIPANGTTVTNLIGIVFQHKVAQIRVRIDARSLGAYATINNLSASFDNSNYVRKGVFSIKGNRISQIEVVPTETIFNGSSATNLWERSYFTVDPQAIRSYRVVLNDLPVTFMGMTENLANRNLATYFGAANRPIFASNFDITPVIGMRLTTTIQLNYQPNALRVLHISSGSSDGFALEQGPSWQFINSKENFGDLPQSIVKIGSWTPDGGAWEGGTATSNSAQNRMTFSTSNAFDNQIRTRLAAGAPNRPDIVIIGFNVSSLSPIFGAALNSFIEDKGVVIMMLQNVSNNDSNTAAFFNNLFGVSNIGFFNNTGASGAMYLIEGTAPNDVILNGDFGDVRGQYWGDDRGPSTLGITNIPPAQATIYSHEQAINRGIANVAGATMFRHNTKSIFFVGDGGFVAYNAGGANNNTAFPFLFDSNSLRPLSKPFGNGGNGYAAGSRNAYNSIIMANVMAWAVRKADLEGIRPWRYAGPPTP